MMERHEAAWVAGIIEGEGTFLLTKQGFGRIRVQMADLDVIERLHEWTGCGHVTGPYLRGSYKPIYSWVVSSTDECLLVGEAIEPWMCLRRGVALGDLLAVERARRARQVARRSTSSYRDRRLNRTADGTVPA